MTDPDDRFRVSFEGKRLLGRYVVGGTLAQGGMGAVYLAHDEGLDDKRVVVKVPHTRFLAEPGFRQRFLGEIKDLLALEHPHVVRILAKGEDEGVPFFVLAHLGGGSLRDRLRRSHAQTPAEIVRWLPDVARTLDFIHGRGVIHRDVKPANVLFDEHGHVYLSDFGIAKALGAADTGLTQTGATPGSPDYMAPEVATQRTLTPAYDQYALAVMVYEALSGALPHGPPGDTPMRTLYRKASEDPPALTTVAPHVGRAVSDVVQRALHRDPAARFATCGAFADAFAAACGGAATSAPTDRTVPAPTAVGVTAVVSEPSGSKPEVTHPPRRRRVGRAALVTSAVVALLGVGAWAAGLFSGTQGPGSTGTDGSRPTAMAPVSPPAPPKPDPLPPEIEVTPPPAMEAAPPPARLPAAPDTRSPTLVVEPAGPDVEANELGEVVFTGRASDEGGALTVRMNGTEVEVVDGAFTATVRQVAEGGSESVEFVARDVAGNETRVERRAKGRPTPPAWRGPLERAKAAGRPMNAGDTPDWESATSAYEEAVQLDVPSSEVPVWLETGVAGWKAPATVTILSPAGVATKTTRSSVEVRARMASPRGDDTLWIGGEKTRTGPGDAARTMSLQVGSTECVVEVRDLRGRVRVSSTVRVERKTPISAKPSWAKTSDEQDVHAAEAGIPVWTETDLGGGESLKFVLVPPGTFTMGSPVGEFGRDSDESQHQVEITQGFYLSIHEVTNGQYRRFESGHASKRKLDGVKQPVVQVSHNDAVGYSRWLSERAGGKTYRLPTESEWEYACRAGTTTPFWFGSTITTAQATISGPRANNEGITYGDSPTGEFRERTKDVGTFSSNGWGLFDMHGNVHEWCRDWYGPYPEGSTSDPQGAPSGVDRVLRGGSYIDSSGGVRSAERGMVSPRFSAENFGFRVVLVVPRG